jgi:hypothetical protein
MIHLSTDKHYSGDSYFRAGFYSNTFTRHFPMDPKACLCYPSQPVLLRPSPKSRSPWDAFSAHEGGVAVPQGILTAAFSVGPVLRFAGNTQWSLGEGARSHAEGTSTSESQDGLWLCGLHWARRQARFLGSGLSLYTWWWPHHPCYRHCHLRFSLFAYSRHLRFHLLPYRSLIG